jgi:hypothetical protein
MKRIVSFGGAALLTCVMGVAQAAAATPTFVEFTEGPGDEAVVDCGSYQIHEVLTFSARVTEYANGTARVHATLDGWLYRSDDPDTVIGKEHAVTVRYIEGSVARVTGNRFHILISGSGMTVHDVGQLVRDFDTGEIITAHGQYSVVSGEFDFGTLCDL